MSDELHSKYSPSQLPRIIRCPGSTTVDQSSESSVYAKEGTLCHDIVSDHLDRGLYTLEPKALDVFPSEDRSELGEAIQDCLDYAFSIISKYDTGAVLIETRVYLRDYVEATGCEYLEEVHGTGDLIIMVPKEGIIYIIDWKFGKGIEVFPDSEQPKAYGLGALKNPWLMQKYDTVHLVIGQPRLYAGQHFKEHITTPAELLSWCADDLVPALNEANGPDPSFNPSEKACQWCAIKATCKARLALAERTAMDVFRIHAELPVVKDIKELLDFLERARDIPGYIKDIEKHIVKTITNGTKVEGFKMVEGRSIRKWDDPKKFVMWASENHPDADIFESKPLSPAKAEKLFKRKIASTDEFQELIIKPPGKHTLVADTDPREAISYEDASDVFSNFTEEN